MGNLLGSGNTVGSNDKNIRVAKYENWEPTGVDYVNQLPNELLIDIFGLLSAEEQGRLCIVCHRWNDIVSSHVLWQYKLFKTYGIWNVSDSQCQPPLVRQAGKVVSVRQVIHDPNESASTRIMYKIRERSSILKNLPPQAQNDNTVRPIRLLLFGLGIESKSTSKIAKLILCGRCSTFLATGLVPGTSSGFGGGIAIKYKCMHDVNIYTLYTNVRSVREKEIDVTMLDNLFAKWMTTDSTSSTTPAQLPCLAEHDDDDKGPAAILPPSVGNRSNSVSRELHDGLKELIASVDGFVYVTDSTTKNHAIDDDLYVSKCQDCLHLIMEEANRYEDTHNRRPILILSCIKKSKMPSYTCYTELDRLKLQKLNNRPWNVCEVDLNSVSELEHGMDWLLYYHFILQDRRVAKSPNFEQDCDPEREHNVEEVSTAE